MALDTVHVKTNSSSKTARPTFHAGDYVTTVTGYPVLYEVLSLEHDDLVRVRGVNWAPGYTAMVTSQEIRPVTHILNR